MDMATFGEYFPSVVTRDSPCWIPGTAPMIEGPRLRTRDNTCLPDALQNTRKYPIVCISINITFDTELWSELCASPG